MQELRKVGQEYKLIRYEFNKEIVIPVNSALMKLTEICDILDAQRIPIEESERKKRKGNFPYYGASGIIDYIDDFIFNEKILCLAEDGENLRSRVLPVAFIIEGKTWVNNHAHVLKPKANVTDVKYLEYFLNHKRYEKYLSFTAQPKLTQEEMKKILVILPPLIEQRKIASILSKVDQLIEKTDQIIEQTQRLKKGLMQKLLTQGVGHTNFKKVRSFFAEHLEIPEEWGIVQLREIANVRYGLSQPPEIDEGIPMIRAANIKKGLIHEKELLRIKASSIPNSKDVYLQHGDIIVVRSGAYTGDIGYISKQFHGAVAGYDLIVSPTRQVDSIWFTNYLLSPRVQNYFSQLKSRVAQPHLNAQELSDTQVYLPPLHEQQKIAAIVSNIDNEIELEKRKKLQQEYLKKGLMQKLLTGEIRVKV